MPARARKSAGQWLAVSTASTRYPGGRFALRKRVVGAQYVRWAAGSSTLRAKLAASGVTFHDTARASAPRLTRRGRQLRRESVSTAIGAAAKRSLAMFSPIGDGTRKATVQATRYVV